MSAAKLAPLGERRGRRGRAAATQFRPRPAPRPASDAVGERARDLEPQLRDAVEQLDEVTAGDHQDVEAASRRRRWPCAASAREARSRRRSCPAPSRRDPPALPAHVDLAFDDDEELRPGLALADQRRARRRHGARRRARRCVAGRVSSRARTAAGARISSTLVSARSSTAGTLARGTLDLRS